MALDAGVTRGDIIHARRVQNIPPCRVIDMCAPGTVTALAPDIPFRYLLGLNVVIHRMAAVACWPRWPLEIVWRIERFPPIPSLRHKIRTPRFVGHIPLCGLGEIIVA